MAAPIVARRTPRQVLALLAVLALTAAPRAAGGQQAERAVTEFEMEVERLALELVQTRRSTLALTQAMRAMREALQNQNVRQLQRAQLEGQLETVRSRLAAMEADGVRLRRQLNALCPAEEKPVGWVGVTYLGDAEWSRDGSGPVVTRFLGFPSVESVEPGSPAEKAGIQGGDLILSIAGRDVRDRSFAIAALLKPGSRIPIRVKRNGDVRTVTVTVERRPDDFETQCGWLDERVAAAFAPPPVRVRMQYRDDGERTVSSGGAPPRRTLTIVRPPAAPAPPVLGQPSSPPAPAVTAAVAPTPAVPPVPPIGSFVNATTLLFGGAQLAAVEGDLAEALGVERGLVVLQAGRGTPAERAGLRSGDVLVSANGIALSSAPSFREAVERAESRLLRLQVVRKKQPMTVELRW